MGQKRLLNIVLAIGIPALLLVILVGTVLPAGANPKDSWSQCANEGDPMCHGQGSSGWVSGKIGSNNGDYTIGDFIAYRAVRSGFEIGMRYCTGAHWDVAKAELPAIDYIGTYTQTVTDADALYGTDVPTTTPALTLAIPADPVLQGGYYLGTITGTFTGTLPFGDVDVDGSQGVMTFWGASDPVIKGYALTDTNSHINMANASQSVELCFTADDTDIVVAWGGHIADPVEWSAPDRPTGSPYHMKTGTNNDVNGDPWFTAPRDAVNDLVEYDPDDPDCDDDSTCDTANHYTVGSQDLQLGIDEPTAITLNSVSTSDSSDGLTMALIGVGLVAIVSAMIIIVRRRRIDAA